MVNFQVIRVAINFKGLSVVIQVHFSRLHYYEKLVRMKGTGKGMRGSKINEITVDDIKNVFKGNEWVYSRWFLDSNFDENLREFNSRRLDIRSMGLESFLKLPYNKIPFSRVNNVIKSDSSRRKLVSFLLRLHSGINLNTMGSSRRYESYRKVIMHSLEELLQLEGFPIHI